MRYSWSGYGYKKRTVAVLAALIVLLAALWQTIYREMLLKTVYPVRYSGYVRQYAAEYHVDESLIYAVIKSESNFDPRARSSIGALGLMQITPDTFNWARSKARDQTPYTAEDLYKPQINIRYGVYLLACLLNEFHDPRTALAAYHAGRGSVNRWLDNPAYSGDGVTLDHIPYESTDTYVGRVLQAQTIYRRLYQGRPENATDAGYSSGIG